MYHVDRRYLLQISGRLRNFKEKRQNLFNCSCPICGDSQYNPLKARGYFYESKHGLRYKCHNCGVNVSFSYLLKNVDHAKYREYVMEKFTQRNQFHINQKWVDKVTSDSESEDISVIGKPDPTFAPTISYLPDGHYAKEYVRNRKIPKERWHEIFYTEDFKAYMDNAFPFHKKDLVENDPRLFWFLTNLHGKITHICARGLKAENKLRYIKIKIAKSDDQKIFGFDHIQHIDPLYVVEGELDSMFLKNAVAPGDSSLEGCANALYENFNNGVIFTIGLRGIVIVYDNQPRNKEIVKQMEQAIKSGHQLVIWPKGIKGKDINDMVLNGHSVEEIEKVLYDNTFTGAEALMKFTEWRKW